MYRGIMLLHGTCYLLSRLHKVRIQDGVAHNDVFNAHAKDGGDGTERVALF
jgi:hypothetical protein